MSYELFDGWRVCVIRCCELCDVFDVRDSCCVWCVVCMWFVCGCCLGVFVCAVCDVRVYEYDVLYVFVMCVEMRVCVVRV